jgi:hypothetical protein
MAKTPACVSGTSGSKQMSEVATLERGGLLLPSREGKFVSRISSPPRRRLFHVYL